MPRSVGRPASGRIELPVQPAYGQHLSVEVVEGEGVVLYGERECVVLTGRLHEQLAPLLDGGSTVDAIIERLGDEHSPEAVYFALLGLADDGHLVEAEPASVSNGTPDVRPHDDARDAFWDSLGDVTRVQRGASKPISIRAPSQAEHDAWRVELQGHGFRIEDAGRVTLVVTNDYLDRSLAEWNEHAIAHGQSWLLARTIGARLWIGPAFVPGESACWECLRQRLARTQPVLAFLTRRRGYIPTLPPTAAASTRQVAAGLVATQLARMFVHEQPRGLVGRLTVIDTVTLETTTHAVARRPQCRACGDPTLYARRAGTEIVFCPRTKRFTGDGGHRIVTPQATIDRLSHLVDPLTGVATELRRMAFGDASVHVFTSGANGATAHRDLTGLRAGLRRSSSGKGLTEAQARASALGEAVERYSAMHQGDEPRIRATFEALSDQAIHPNRCMLYSDAQYEGRPGKDRAVPTDEWVPPRFDERAPIEWTPIWSMTERRTKYLPTSFLYLGYLPREGANSSPGDSNGNAAGNSLEEAVLQGFLELVERDGTALWWYNRASRPAIDLDTVHAAGWDETRDFYRRLGREMWVLDVTTDLEIPTFVAVSRCPSQPQEEILLGLGAHLDPRIAATRAVSEMNQMLAALESLRDGVGVNATLGWWLEHATLANQPYLAPAPTPGRHLDELPRVEHTDLRDDVLWCQRLVEARGMELLVLDQTRPDIDVPVVKVVVPGLRHFRPRFAAGRLYDAPVRLGWLSRPTPEPDLNPAPFFL